MVRDALALEKEKEGRKLGETGAVPEQMSRQTLAAPEIPQRIQLWPQNIHPPGTSERSLTWKGVFAEVIKVGDLKVRASWIREGPYKTREGNLRWPRCDGSETEEAGP